MGKKRGKKLKKNFVRRFFFQKAQYFVILLIKIRKVQKKPPFSDLADSAKPKFSRHREAKKSHFGGIPPLLATLLVCTVLSAQAAPTHTHLSTRALRLHGRRQTCWVFILYLGSAVPFLLSQQTSHESQAE